MPDETHSSSPPDGSLVAFPRTCAAKRPPDNNLPLELSSFVGRVRETAEVKSLLTSHRLLTLTGPGGSGKTRLALEVAGDIVGDYPDGVWMVELASLSDQYIVHQAVAGALSVREQPGRPLTATLADYLGVRRLLLVLDNCEHLVASCATLADALLRACPNLRILATSREALNISGENAWLVPSLFLPDPEQRPPVEELLARYEAIRLFTERAKEVVSTFELTEHNASAVARVCRRLDGIPLAIELAAARVRVLSVEQISSRLEDSFGLLAGGSRTALPRQQTLRAALAWSRAEEAEGETGLRLSGAQFWFWFFRGYWSEGRGWLDGALGSAGGRAARTAVRAKALCGAGLLAWMQGYHAAARSRLEESVTLWRELGDKQGLAQALRILSHAMLGQGDPAVARSLGEESVELFREGEDKFGLATSLATLGIVALTQEDYVAAWASLEESVAICRETEDDWALSLALRNLGIAAFRQGGHERAVALLKESMAGLREPGRNTTTR